MKFQRFAARPLMIAIFVALSNFQTALGETTVPERHDETTPKAEATPTATAIPVLETTARPGATPTVNPKVSAVEALRAELDKLSDNALVDVLRESQNASKKADDTDAGKLDRKKLEEALKKVAPFDKVKAKDELLRKLVLDSFKKAADLNPEVRPDSLLSIAIADVLRARAKRPTATVTATATVSVTGTAAPKVSATPTLVPTVTPTLFVSDPNKKALEDQLKKLQDEAKLAKDLSDQLAKANDAGAGAGAGAGQGAGGGEGSGSGDKGGGGDSGSGSGDNAGGDSKGGDKSAKKDDAPSTPPKDDAKTKSAEVPPALAETKKEEKEKREPLDLTPKTKSTPFPELNVGSFKKAEPTPAANPGDGPVQSVPRQRNEGPSEALTQAIPSSGGGVSADGSYGGGSYGGQGGSGGGSNGRYATSNSNGATTGGGDSVTSSIGNFSSGGGGGGGNYTYIKTGPGDWLQGSGGGGMDESNGFGGGPAYDEAATVKPNLNPEQILRVGALDPALSGAGTAAASGRGLAGAGAALAGTRGVFSSAPTVKALLAVGRVVLRSKSR